jgi:hypothetical protein
VANIDRIVKVQIALRTAGVRQVTFSDLLLLGVHTGPNRVDIITEADTLLVAPFSLATTDDLYLAAQVAFSQIPGPTRIFIGRRGVGEAVNVALAACAVANDGWYGFTDVSHTEADLLLAAAWAEANTKLFLTALSDVDILASSGAEPATALMTSNFFRTAWWYNADPNQFPEVAEHAPAGRHRAAAYRDGLHQHHGEKRQLVRAVPQPGADAERHHGRRRVDRRDPLPRLAG